ncbi:nucleotidyl transferase AbiEii/AbiGii toxin family protein [Aquabacterium sp.]|uniref:nucleotidyl transferase AbiEii/AbiGii toxin family protein n=1 Tax=Aquabacterium sp. TaxID=1872578 RepID=UPI003BAED84B
MFKRPHHQRVARILDALNVPLLTEAACYFGGGTAIVLLLNEYRESVDVDLLCASHEGYRTLRNAVNENSLGPLLTQALPLARSVRADRYGIRTFLMVDDVPIKFEIVREDRIPLQAQTHPGIPIPTLSQVDMFAEKLLANTDRWADRSTTSRDIIDLAMMVHHWGPIPPSAWLKVEDAYGASARRAFAKAQELLADEAYLAECLRKMSMDARWADDIRLALRACETMPASHSN